MEWLICARNKDTVGKSVHGITTAMSDEINKKSPETNSGDPRILKWKIRHLPGSSSITEHSGRFRSKFAFGGRI